MSEQPDLPGLRFDAGKPRMDLVPPSVMTAIATVAAFGAGKYGDRNWERGMPYSKVYAPLMRHLMAWWQGEHLDAESGLPHLYHIAWNAAALVEYARRLQDGTLPMTVDDRPHVVLDLPAVVTLPKRPLHELLYEATQGQFVAAGLMEPGPAPQMPGEKDPHRAAAVDLLEFLGYRWIPEEGAWKAPASNDRDAQISRQMDIPASGCSECFGCDGGCMPGDTQMLNWLQGQIADFFSPLTLKRTNSGLQIVSGAYSSEPANNLRECIAAEMKK